MHPGTTVEAPRRIIGSSLLVIMRELLRRRRRAVMLRELVSPSKRMG
jgi:hypothetical protein